MNIKRILQNKQYQFLICVIVAIILIMLISSFTKPSPKRVTLISDDLLRINNQIVLWSKYGYEIEVLIAQPIAVLSKTGQARSYSNPTPIIYKGNLLLIMKKD
jgi:hypothetical protein